MKNKIKHILLDLLIYGTFYFLGKYVSESYQSGWIFGSLALALTVLINKIRENKNNLQKTCTIKKD